MEIREFAGRLDLRNRAVGIFFLARKTIGHREMLCSALDSVRHTEQTDTVRNFIFAKRNVQIAIGLANHVIDNKLIIAGLAFFAKFIKIGGS